MFSSSSIFTTFLASVESIGTAMILALGGIYLHRRQFLAHDEKRTLAKISKQLTLPLLLFSSTIWCDQNGSSEACPDVTKSLADVWLLLFWPLVVVSAGLLVGYTVARLVGAKSQSHRRSIMAACSLGNSTGLPLTLLASIHVTLSDDHDLGRVDPTLFLSVYLLLYPVIQWAVGGWLLTDNVELMHPPTEEPSEHLEYPPVVMLAPVDQPEDDSDDFGDLCEYQCHPPVNKTLSKDGEDEQEQSVTEEPSWSTDHSESSLGALFANKSATTSTSFPLERTSMPIIAEARSALERTCSVSSSVLVPGELGVPQDDEGDATASGGPKARHWDKLWTSFKTVLSHFWQPPAIGAMLGILVAATPLRGVLVDVDDRNGSAPLQFLTNGLYALGRAAIPLNMIILGCNLSASWMSRPTRKPSQDVHATQEENQQELRPTETDSSSSLSSKTMAAIVFGKMIVMPLIGMALVLLFKEFVLSVPDDIDGAFYAVLMVVFITPTANNVMVMCELSGSNLKEGLAQTIALQYACAPVLLSISMSLVVGISNQ